MLDYQSFSTVFMDSGYSPAEGHAILTAYACGNQPVEAVIDLLLGEENAHLSSSLIDLYRVVYQDLLKTDFSFSLLLAESDATFSQRTQALKAWCQSFLNGLELTQIKQKKFSEDVTEALAFFKSMVELEISDEQQSEEADEKDLLELEEYVRMAVLLIYTELGSATTPKSIH